ncbi:MAG: hypothetical protein DRG69_09170 [Deltaproteobacteria bacterium]|nr:MAG: hypothetical protein DRG69_09170 [Deltaproteobacteria bacterium]
MISIPEISRSEVARKLSEIISRKYGDNIYLVALYGSVARGEEGEYSDIDLYVVTQNISKRRYFAYRNIPITIEYYRKDDIQRILYEVSSTWPSEVYHFLHPKVLYERGEVVREFREIVKQIPDEKFKEAASIALIEIYENICKTLNAIQRGNLGRCIEAIWNIAWHSDNFIGLVNKTYFEKPGFRALDEIERLNKKPRRYAYLMKILWTSRDFNTIKRVINELWNSILEFSRKEEIIFRNYAKLDEDLL